MSNQSQPNLSNRPATVSRRFDVADLLQGQKEIRLVYRGVEYRLRVTRQEKLILTK